MFGGVLMDVIRLKPEKELKSLWVITWMISLILGIFFWLILLLVIDFWVVIILVFAWIVIMIPIIIWIPAAFRALEYYIDDEGVKMKGGVVWKKYVTVPYSKITNVDVIQGPMQRYYNIGTIHVQTAGAGGKQGEKAELKINGIRELEKVRKSIIGRIRDSSHYVSGMTKKEKESIQPENISVFKYMLKELEEIKNLLKQNKDK
jgi:membrane protein YdbS with pleckstrin-like domain